MSQAARCCAGALLLLLHTSGLSADEPRRGESAPDAVIAREASKIFQLRLGLRVQAASGPVERAVASSPALMEWPEQQVSLVDSESPAGWRVETRRLGGTAEQMLLEVPLIPVGSEIVFARTYDVTCWTQRLRPEAHDRLTAVPKTKLRGYLQPSDGIESQHAEIRRFAAEAVGEETAPLERATLIFNATRKQLTYRTGKFIGALAGLRGGQGDCEEFSSLFVALCRASGIPARLVRGPGHCWAEFALADRDGEIIWVPADPTKERRVGVISHPLPILQKGDRFRPPDARGQTVRFITPRCSGLGATPLLESIEELDDAAVSAE